MEKFPDGLVAGYTNAHFLVGALARSPHPDYVGYGNTAMRNLLTTSFGTAQNLSLSTPPAVAAVSDDQRDRTKAVLNNNLPAFISAIGG